MKIFLDTTDRNDIPRGAQLATISLDVPEHLFAYPMIDNGSGMFRPGGEKARREIAGTCAPRAFL